MLRPKPYIKTGKAWGYAVVRGLFIHNLFAWDELGETVNRLVLVRLRTGAAVSLQYARYARDKTALAFPNRGEGNRAMRRMSALYDIECKDEPRETPPYQQRGRKM
jgi:hypothetical protein